jgi:hypothetical protein
VPEIRLPHDEAAAKMCQSLGYMLDRIRVLIQGQNIRASLQERLCVTTTATRCIDNERTWFRLE